MTSSPRTEQPLMPQPLLPGAKPVSTLFSPRMLLQAEAQFQAEVQAEREEAEQLQTLSEMIDGVRPVDDEWLCERGLHDYVHVLYVYPPAPNLPDPGPLGRWKGRARRWLRGKR